MRKVNYEIIRTDNSKTEVEIHLYMARKEVIDTIMEVASKLDTLYAKREDKTFYVYDDITGTTGQVELCTVMWTSDSYFEYWDDDNSPYSTFRKFECRCR